MKYEQILLLSAKEARKRQKELFAKNGVQLLEKFYSTCISKSIMDNDVNNHERFKWMVILG